MSICECDVTLVYCFSRQNTNRGSSAGPVGYSWKGRSFTVQIQSGPAVKKAHNSVEDGRA